METVHRIIDETEQVTVHFKGEKGACETFSRPEDVAALRAYVRGRITPSPCKEG